MCARDYVWAGSGHAVGSRALSPSSHARPRHTAEGTRLLSSLAVDRCAVWSESGGMPPQRHLLRTPTPTAAPTRPEAPGHPPGHPPGQPPWPTPLATPLAPMRQGASVPACVSSCALALARPRTPSTSKLHKACSITNTACGPLVGCGRRLRLSLPYLATPACFPVAGTGSQAIKTHRIGSTNTSGEFSWRHLLADQEARTSAGVEAGACLGAL